MEKYTAFNLYRSGWTTQGTAVAVALEPDSERREVYLAADVHALLREIEQADDPAVAGTALRDLMVK